jgi:hypothetical protein
MEKPMQSGGTSRAKSTQDRDRTRSRTSPTDCPDSEGSEPLDPEALDREVEEMFRKGEMPSLQQIAEALRQVKAEMEFRHKPIPKGHLSLRRPN